jgi:ankyrin repeat protein
VLNGNIGAVQEVLEEGVNPDAINKEGLTPLMLTTKHDDVNMANLLIKYGADINAVDTEGKSVLMHAIINNAKKVLGLLLQNSVRISKEEANNQQFAKILINNKNLLSSYVNKFNG